MSFENRGGHTLSDLAEAYVDVQDLLKNLSQYLSCIQLRTAIRADPDVGDVENYVVDNDRETRNEDEDIEEPKTKMEIDWSGIANTITAVKNWFTHRFVHRTIVKQNDDNLEYRRRFTRRPCSVEHLSYVDDAEKDGCPGAVDFSTKVCRRFMSCMRRKGTTHHICEPLICSMVKKSVQPHPPCKHPLFVCS